ncbi:MAG: hypothetical protein ACKVWR_06305 [Acidimicrobiales bacterium]
MSTPTEIAAEAQRLTVERKSRAVLRTVEAGNYIDCALCGERIKFQAKLRLQQVICNVYEDGRWDRVEHYHAQCYTDAREPYGATD